MVLEEDLRVFKKHLHFKAIRITALLLADLTVEPQSLKSFRLKLIIELLDRSEFCFGHFGVVLEGLRMVEGGGRWVVRGLWMCDMPRAL